MLKKGIKKLFLIFIFAVIMLLVFTSCSEKKSSTAPVRDTMGTEINIESKKDDDEFTTCILLGKTANVRFPDSSLIKKELEKLAENKESYCVIVLDGNPDEISAYGEVYFPNRLFNQEANNNKVMQGHLYEIMNLMPEDAEIDILEGLKSAKRALSNSSNKKRLVISSSGISTIGELNFAKNPDLINKPPSEIVENLEKNKSLPDLSGIEVVWFGFGDVAGTQNELSNLNAYRLKKIWMEILKACNVSDTNNVFNDLLPFSEDFNEKNNIDLDYPQVTPADFSDIISINEEDIGFLGDKAEFKDKAVAIASLAYYAECINNSNSSFYIVGSTATIGSEEECFELSEQRANAVKDILCNSYGVSKDSVQIFALGQYNLGGNYEWRSNDLNKDGSLNEEIAKQNRRVFIIDSESEKGKNFLQQWNEH